MKSNLSQSMIATKFKCDEILTATEATALAIHDITPSNQNNMEQQIIKLIDKAISKTLKNFSASPPTPPTPPQKNEKTLKAARSPNLGCQKTKGRKECIIPIPSVQQRHQRKRRGRGTTTATINEKTKAFQPRTTTEMLKNPKRHQEQTQPSALKTIQATTYLNSPYNLHCNNLCNKLIPPTAWESSDAVLLL
jgi:hypothetical protein